MPGSASEDVTFDATLHKGSGEVRGEVLLRDRARSRFTLGLFARAEGDTIRLDLAGEGGSAHWRPGFLPRWSTPPGRRRSTCGPSWAFPRATAPRDA